MAIVIADADSGRVYNRQLIKNGGEFAIEYIHSVHQSPVREIFAVDTMKIKPVAARFFSFGAGMQTELEEGQQMSRDGEAFVITGYNRVFTELNYIVGTVSDHLLIMNGESISLRELCGKNARVTVRIQEHILLKKLHAHRGDAL